MITHARTSMTAPPIHPHQPGDDVAGIIHGIDPHGLCIVRIGGRPGPWIGYIHTTDIQGIISGHPIHPGMAMGGVAATVFQDIYTIQLQHGYPLYRPRRWPRRPRQGYPVFMPGWDT